MMAERIGTVADVAVGKIDVGYAVFHGLTGEDAIYGGSEVVDHPIAAYQLKIQPAGDSAVRVTVVDLAVGIVWANRPTREGADFDNWRQEAYQRRAGQAIRWARQLKPNSVLRVT